MSLCHCLMENSRILIFLTSNNYVITFEDSMLKRISILEFSKILFIFLCKILFFWNFNFVENFDIITNNIICVESHQGTMVCKLMAIAPHFLLTINCFNKTCWLSTSITIYIKSFVGKRQTKVTMSTLIVVDYLLINVFFGRLSFRNQINDFSFGLMIEKNQKKKKKLFF